MRLLFVNQYYAPDCAATAQVLEDLCLDARAAGHEVHVLAGRAPYAGVSEPLPEEEIRQGVHVHRIGGTEARRARYRDRLVGYMGFHCSVASRLLTLPKPDVAIFLTTPPLIGLHGLLLRALRGVPIAMWVMDTYPDIAFRSGLLSPKAPPGRLWSALGDGSLRRADRVITLSSDMKDVLVSKGIAPERLDVIPCWSDGAAIAPHASAGRAFREEHFPGSGTVIAYSGNAGTCHSFNALVSGIRRLRERTDITFAFIGGGKRYPSLQRSLSSEGNRVRFLPYQPREVLGESLAAADVHVVTLDPTFDGLLLPSKLFGIMAAARPILFLGSENSTPARIVRETRCGIVVPHNLGVTAADAIEWFADHPEEAAEMGRRGRERFDAEFRRDLLTARMLSSLAGIPATVGTVQESTASLSSHDAAQRQI